VAQRENRLLLTVAAVMGCLILVCLVIALLAGGLALIWTLEGTLGPGGSSSLPALSAALL